MHCNTLTVPLIIAIIVTPALAQDATLDKRGYTLFNPTPRELWRPLSADRPDFTESPYTVDAGAVQLEMSFVDYVKDGDTQQWTAAPFNLKLGLLNNTDIQFVFDPYVYVDEEDGENFDGIGDTQVRLKINLWGNDADGPAFGFMPFIKLPTASDGLGNDHVEGGLIFPFATDIAEGVGLGLMFETDFVFDDVDDAYDTEFIGTAAIGVDVTDRIGAYVEGIGISSTDSETDFRALLGGGGTYLLKPNVVLDAGVNIGLTDDTDDVNLFTGLTVRF